MKQVAALLVAVTSALAACSHQSVQVERPTNQAADTAVTKLWTNDVARVARDGDWILTRSYSLNADGITVATTGEDLSHASMYSARTTTIIESIGSGVREIPLDQLLARNHYVMVVRPHKMSAEDQREAVDRARSRIGAAYDASGLVGIDHEDRFYCSELVYWASQTEARSGRHETVITPAELVTYGEVIYWSGLRTDPQVMAIASAR